MGKFFFIIDLNIWRINEYAAFSHRRMRLYRLQLHPHHAFHGFHPVEHPAVEFLPAEGLMQIVVAAVFEKFRRNGARGLARYADQADFPLAELSADSPGQLHPVLSRHGRTGGIHGRFGVQKIEGEIVVFRHGDAHGLLQFPVGLRPQFGDRHDPDRCH